MKKKKNPLLKNPNVNNSKKKNSSNLLDNLGGWIPIVTGIFSLIGGLGNIASYISSSISEIKYYKILPEEYEKEKKQAEIRLNKYKDIFHPSYDEYLEILKKAKDTNSISVIKWERHYTTSEWTIHIPKIEELASYDFEK